MQLLDTNQHVNHFHRLISRMAEPLKIVGLGSSFAAGPGLKPLTNSAAGRSSVNYVNLLAKLLSTSRSAECVDLTVSGATLLNVHTETQVCGSVEFPPQISMLPSDADIVTLTAGGNDLSYIGGLMLGSIRRTAYVGRLLDLALKLSGRVPGPNTPPTAEDVTKRFVAIIDTIHAKAPGARIILVTYLTCLGDDIEPAVNTQLSKEQIDDGRKTAETLRRCYIDAQGQRSSICELVDVSEESKAHGVGSDDPWMAGWDLTMLWTGTTPFHPTYKGHEYIAQRLYRIVAEGHDETRPGDAASRR